MEVQEEKEKMKVRIEGIVSQLGQDVSSCLVDTFSWVLPDKLAGSSCPGNPPASLLLDLKILGELGISCIVSLNESGLDTKEVEKVGMKHVVVPVADYRPPSREQMVEFVELVDGESCVLVHCNAGMGRTGTMLASYLIYQGMSASEAIKKLRKERRGSIQTFKQEDGLKDFEKYLKEKINR